jgi:Predicted integral membrane protein
MAKINNNNNKKKKHLLYSLFNPAYDGKGVPKKNFDPNAPRNITLFFKMFWRNISNLFTLNMYFVIGNFPVLIFMLGLSGNLNKLVNTASSLQYGAFYGIFNNMPLSPVSGALLGVYGIPAAKQILTPATYVMFALGALVLLTFGPVRVGVTYVLRNMVKGEPLFIWQDFRYAVKRNWKQGLLIGIIDLIASALFAFDFIFFLANAGSFTNNLLFAAIVMVCIYYAIMRFYIYIIVVTFDLKLIKILKNSLIFTLINFKRNIVAVLGIAFLVFINYYLFLVFMPLGVMFPFVLLFSTEVFMGIYAAWPKIDIMVDHGDSDKQSESGQSEPVFRDMG